MNLRYGVIGSEKYINSDLNVLNFECIKWGGVRHGDFPSVLRDKLKDIPNLKSNKGERSVILEILACIGVLNPGSYDRATSGKHDWTFVEYWRGEDGYDIKAVDKYFGKYL